MAARGLGDRYQALYHHTTEEAAAAIMRDGFRGEVYLASQPVVVDPWSRTWVRVQVTERWLRTIEREEGDSALYHADVYVTRAARLNRAARSIEIITAADLDAEAARGEG